MPGPIDDNLREISRRLRGSMLRGLTGETLGAALDGFERGNIAPAAMLWQQMTERDDVLTNVKAKREKALSRRDWDIVTEDDSDAARAHAEVLKDFWNNRVSAVSAYDINETGGVSRLVRQMLSAVSFKYSVHHLAWSVADEKLTCRFEHVPLWFFENVSGALRFLPNGRGLRGRPLEPGRWMTCTGDGLMIAASFGYLAKRNTLADWLAFSEKFGVPGVLGRTPHADGTPGAQSMREAVEAFTSDWSAVICGDEGGGKIELLSAQGGSLPMPPLIERIDRRFAALWRGADLSSISSTSGQGTGASLQEQEALILELDDAMMIQEKLWDIERAVIAWHFGERVEPLAYLKFVIPQPEDSKATLEALKSLVELGAPVSAENALSRFGFPMPDADAMLLEPRDKYTSAYTKAEETTAPQPKTRNPEPETNQELNAAAESDAFIQSCAALLRKAAAKDHAQIAAAVRALINTPDGLFADAMRRFVESLPEQVANDAAQVKAWERVLSTAWLRAQSDAQEEEQE